MPSPNISHRSVVPMFILGIYTELDSKVSIWRASNGNFWFTFATCRIVQKLGMKSKTFYIHLCSSFFATIRFQQIFYHSLSGVGKWFTNVVRGSTSSVTKSNSVFEAKIAFNNQEGVLNEGQNGNYNIVVNITPYIRPMILECSNSAPTCTWFHPLFYLHHRNRTSTTGFQGGANVMTFFCFSQFKQILLHPHQPLSMRKPFKPISANHKPSSDSIFKKPQSTRGRKTRRKPSIMRFRRKTKSLAPKRMPS